MARLLVKRIDYTDPGNDSMSYKRGDVVDVGDDGIVWDKIEDDVDPQFAIINTPGTSTAFKHLQGPKIINTGGPNNDEREIVLRREWTIDFDDMTSSELDDLDSPPYKRTMSPGRVNVLSKQKP